MKTEKVRIYIYSDAIKAKEFSAPIEIRHDLILKNYVFIDTDSIRIYV